MTDGVAVATDTTGIDQVAALYGPASYPTDGTIVLDPGIFPGGLFTLGVSYSIITLAAFGVLCFLLYSFRPHISVVLNIVRGKLYVEKLLGEHNHFFDMFINYLIAYGFLLVSFCVVKTFDMAGLSEGIDMPVWMVSVSTIVLWIVVLAVWVLQGLIVRGTGKLTLSSKFSADMFSMRRLVYGLGFIVLSPLMLLYSTATGNAAVVIGILLLAGFAAMFIFLLYRTYVLFLDQKISILYWFLYLCAVEIFPVSLPVIIVLRNLA